MKINKEKLNQILQKKRKNTDLSNKKIKKLIILSKKNMKKLGN